jgi:hypothetical protein
MIGVEQWAEIRRMHRVERLSIRAIHRRNEVERRFGLAARRARGPWYATPTRQ